MKWGLIIQLEIYCEDDDEVETYRIVTSVRGSSLNGLVSIESPIGKALLGHKEGDRVYVKVNDDLRILCGDPQSDQDRERSGRPYPEFLRGGRMIRYKTVLFDLDGTITDSGTGIMNAIRYAVRKYGLAEPEEAVLRSFIGPPLKEQFRKVFGLSEEEGRRMVALVPGILRRKRDL